MTMSGSDRPTLITVPWRKVCAGLPAVVLIAGGTALSLSAPPSRGINEGAVSRDSPAVVVPDIALSLPGPAGIPTQALPLAGRGTPAPPTKDGVPGGSPSQALASNGIPARALAGYRLAASLVSSADPSCHVDWPLLAAIGRVESNHGRFAGNGLDPAGVARPGIFGVALDGSNATARITDSDDGRLDHDTVYDRAVGPMQFIPSTWGIVGVDADGDGAKNPQDIADAASAAAIYLCSGPGDLSRPADLRSAILRYNASDAYAQMVAALANSYRRGVSVLPDPAVTPAGSTDPAGRPGSIPTVPGQKPAATLEAPTSSPPTSATAVPPTDPPVTTPPGTTPPGTTTSTTVTAVPSPTATSTCSTSTSEPTVTSEPTLTSEPTATATCSTSTSASTLTSEPTATAVGSIG